MRCHGIPGTGKAGSSNEEEVSSQWKLCGKGPGWAWITATWQARIKTSDLSSEAKGPLACVHTCKGIMLQAAISDIGDLKENVADLLNGLWTLSNIDMFSES